MNTSSNKTRIFFCQPFLLHGIKQVVQAISIVGYIFILASLYRVDDLSHTVWIILASLGISKSLSRQRRWIDVQHISKLFFTHRQSEFVKFFLQKQLVYLLLP